MRAFIFFTFVLGCLMTQTLATLAKLLCAKKERIQSLGILSISGIAGVSVTTEPLSDSTPKRMSRESGLMYPSKTTFSCLRFCLVVSVWGTIFFGGSFFSELKKDY